MKRKQPIQNKTSVSYGYYRRARRKVLNRSLLGRILIGVEGVKNGNLIDGLYLIVALPGDIILTAALYTLNAIFYSLDRHSEEFTYFRKYNRGRQLIIVVGITLILMSMIFPTGPVTIPLAIISNIASAFTASCVMYFRTRHYRE